MKNLRRNPIFYIVLIIGILSAGFIVFQRSSMENKDNHIAGAMEFADICTLSEKGGLTVNDWLKPLTGSGMEYLIVSEDTALDAEPYLQKYGLKSVWLDSGKEFPQNITEPDLVIPDVKGDLTIDDINSDVPLGLIENNTRTGLNLPDTMENITAQELLDKNIEPVKVLYLYKGYRYMWNEQIGGDEVEALIFRAVTDRSARFIWLEGMTDKTFKNTALDPYDYSGIFDKLAVRLAERGLVFGNDFSVRVPNNVPNIAIGLAGLTSVALTVLFFAMLIKNDIVINLIFFTIVIKKDINKIFNVLLIAGSAFCIIACYIIPINTYQTLASIYTAVLIPCIAGVYLRNLYFTESNKSDYLRYIVYSIAFLIGSIAGGLLVGSFLSTEGYLLEFYIYKGVKLSQFIPLAFTIALFGLVAIKMPKPKQTNKLLKFLPIITTVVIIGGVVIIMLIRSGDVKSTPKIEEFIRDFLENTLYTRPRTKEFACAWPSIAVFLWSQKRKLSFLALPFGMISVITTVSIVNTFCHIYTVLPVSIIRTFLGFGIGFIIGVIAILVLNTLEKLFTKFILPKLN